MSSLGVAGDEVLAIEGVSQFVRQRIGCTHHVEAGIRFGVGVDVGVHQFTRSKAHVIWHQHQLSKRRHQPAEGAFNAEEGRRVGAVKDGAVHVDVDGQSARVVKSLRHKQRTADLDGVAQEGHVVGDAVGVDVVVRRKRFAGNPKHCRRGRKLRLRVAGQQFCGLGKDRGAKAQQQAEGEEDAVQVHGVVLDQGTGPNTNKARRVACLVAICAWRREGRLRGG